MAARQRRSGPAAEAAGPAVTGVDACARGWVAVTLWPGSLSPMPFEVPEPGPANPPRLAPRGRRSAEDLSVRVSVAATLDGLPLTGLTGIDMPLGLLADGWRDADLLARRALGRRGVTVFAIPPRPVWECESHAEANRLCRDLTGKGFSVQAWGLRRKIAEADEFRRRAGRGPDGVRLYEVHPELAFAALAGAPLTDSKHTKAGLAIRRELLAREGITLPNRGAGVPDNDLLDAAAVAWSARRIAAGQAVVLANPAQQADDGTEIAVRY